MPTAIKLKVTPTQRKHIELWIDALRSKEFLQTQGRLLHFDDLTSEHRYCCLGVACELYSWNVGGYWDYDSAFVADPMTVDGSQNYNYTTPPIVAQWYGIPDKIIDEAASMNDNGSSFASIANYLESCLA